MAGSGEIYSASALIGREPSEDCALIGQVQDGSSLARISPDILETLGPEFYDAQKSPPGMAVYSV